MNIKNEFAENITDTSNLTRQKLGKNIKVKILTAQYQAVRIVLGAPERNRTEDTRPIIDTASPLLYQLSYGANIKNKRESPYLSNSLCCGTTRCIWNETAIKSSVVTCFFRLALAFTTFPVSFTTSVTA